MGKWFSEKPAQSYTPFNKPSYEEVCRDAVSQHNTSGRSIHAIENIVIEGDNGRVVLTDREEIEAFLRKHR
jgi:hypothetical protein